MIVESLPKQIRITGKLVKIKTITRSEAIEHGVWGMFIPDENLITLCNEQSPADLLDTLLHEVLHAIYYYWNMQDTDDEERTVHTLASALQAIYVENQHFHKCIGRLAKISRESLNSKD